MNIVFLHGLNSTCTTFNFIIDKLQLAENSVTKITYDSHNRVSKILEEVIPQLPPGQFSIVGHSLGGVIATLIAEKFPRRVLKLAVISSPLKGSRPASCLMFIPGHLKILEDLAPLSPVMRHISNLKLSTPTLSLISTGGHFPVMPFFDEPNDSVVSVSSQKGLSFGEKWEIPVNHFEMLMDRTALKTLGNFLKIT